MPGEVTVQSRLPRIVGDPALDEPSSALVVPPLVEHVGPRVRGVGVARLERERALDQRRPRLPAEGLGAREAVRAQEPPVLPVGGREPVEQRQHVLVALLPAAHADEPVDAVGRGEGHHVARELGQVLADQGERAVARAGRGGGQGLDVPPLAPLEPTRARQCRRRRGPPLGAATGDQQAPRPADVGQREAGIGGERAIEPLERPLARGEQPIHRVDVHGGRGGRRRE